VSGSKVAVLIAILAVALVSYQIIGDKEFERDSTVTPDGVAESELPTNIPAQQAAVKPIVTGATDEQRCLTMAEVRENSAVRQLMRQLDAAAARGADIEIFRGLDEAEILGYAEQGDSAAMIVTGAILVLQAYGSNSSRAIDWLSGDGYLEDVDPDQPVSPNAGLALNDAAYWFYRAALHGRLLALQHYGEVRSQLFGGPVGLGWISRDEYDLLETDQRDALAPAKVYRSAALDMIPGANAGFIQGTTRLPSTNEIADPIRNEILHEFNMALSDSDLPPPATTTGDVGAFERLRLRICASE